MAPVDGARSPLRDRPSAARCIAPEIMLKANHAKITKNRVTAPSMIALRSGVLRVGLAPIGLPHFGHAGAASEIWAWQSGQVTRAIP